LVRTTPGSTPDEKDVAKPIDDLEPALVCRLKIQLLNAPVEKFRDKQLVLAGTSHFVDPAKLAKLFAGLAQNAENFAVER
jgi:hypothetical protein